jgi:hypothetical protein
MEENIKAANIIVKDLSIAEDSRTYPEPPPKNFADLFKRISDYNDFNWIFRDDAKKKLMGMYGCKAKVLMIFVDALDEDELVWLCPEIAAMNPIDIGYTLIFSTKFPRIKLVGTRQRKTALMFYIKELMRADPYYKLARSSKELRETVPFLPTDPIGGKL